MSSPRVRSAVLAAHAFDAATQTWMISCPVGQTLLLKTIYAYNSATTDVVLNVQYIHAASGTFMYLVRQSLPANSVLNLSTWFVLAEQDAVGVQTSSGGLSIQFSGTVLTGVADYTPLPIPNQHFIPSPLG